MVGEARSSEGAVRKETTRLGLAEWSARTSGTPKDGERERSSGDTLEGHQDTGIGRNVDVGGPVEALDGH